MITIIAEKPSVAMEIARIVGARSRKDGYMEGGGYAVTWALGHLVEIWAEGDDDWGAPLPLLPQQFQLRVARKKRKDGKSAPPRTPDMPSSSASYVTFSAAARTSSTQVMPEGKGN